MTLRSLSAYGRAMRMRSCALRILLAATISMARVIFCVFCTLLILVRISLPIAMAVPDAYQLELALKSSSVEGRVLFLLLGFHGAVAGIGLLGGARVRGRGKRRDRREFAIRGERHAHA